MCNFFSFVGDGYGNFKYMDAIDRNNHKTENCDSHTFILTANKIRAGKQHLWSKYEYTPLTKQFTVDDPASGHDHAAAQSFVESLNFKRIVPELIIKPIFNPMCGRAKKVKQEHIDLLDQWASVRASVGDSVRDSVWASVWDSVRDSVWASVWDSVGDSVWNSVWDSVWAYMSSFVKCDYKYDFTPAIKLWERGLVPSFDGTTWRLHSGKDAKIVYEWKK